MKRIHLLPFLCLPLLHCGGGGGGSSSAPQSYTVTTNNASISGVVFDHQWACANYPVDGMTVTGRISPMPEHRIYPVVTATSSGLDVAGATVYTNSDGTFTANFIPDCFLPVGTYTGSLSLSLFSDSGHTVPLPASSQSLTYTVEVKPQLSVTSVKMDGAPLSPVTINTQNPLGAIGITNGALLELDTNIPVTWSNSAGPGLVIVSPTPGSTATAWQGHLTLATPSGTNSVQLIGVSKDLPGQHVSVTVTLSH